MKYILSKSRCGLSAPSDNDICHDMPLIKTNDYEQWSEWLTHALSISIDKMSTDDQQHLKLGKASLP